MPALDIFFISLSVLLAPLYFYRRGKINITPKEFLGIISSSVLLSCLSFFVVIVKVGGTVMYESRGWPHFFYQYQIKDILDNIPIEKGYFIFGGFYSYIISNTLFYFSIIFFIVILWKKIQNTLNHSNK